MDMVVQTPRRLCLKVVGMQWVVLITLIGLCLIAAGVIAGLSAWNARIWIGWLMSGGLIFAGCVAIAVVLIDLPLWTLYSFDKDLGCFRLERRMVVGKKVREWRLQEIHSVKVTKIEDQDSIHYVILVTFKAGETVQLRDTTESPEPQEYDAIVQHIGQFLGLSDTQVE